MVAASAGFSKACVMLLEHGANINSIDQNGRYRNHTFGVFLIISLSRYYYITSCNR